MQISLNQTTKRLSLITTLTPLFGEQKHNTKRIMNKTPHWWNLTQIATLATVFGVLANEPAALAWKPTTHVSLAEQALFDAIDDGDDGKVSIFRVDYEQGQVLGKIGDYQVDPGILLGLKNFRSQYRAGVLGPDAYPDILTGQQVIHPDTNSDGTNGWLEYLWTRATTPEQKAFVTGFLTHAAGDMYGHTFVNNFTGGPFTFEPPDNAIKHILLEGYVDKRAPIPKYEASIAKVEDFIYRNMIDAKPGTVLDSKLLTKGGEGTKLSIPRIYSTLRANLQKDIDQYNAQIASFDRRIDAKLSAAANCKPLDFTCSRIALGAEAAVLKVEKEAYRLANGLIVEYKEEWRDDIDDGLKAWPKVSHEVAQALFFNPEKKANVDKAEKILKDYAINHLISMSGSPDVVGDLVGIADKIGDIISAITPDFLLEPVRKLKDNIYDAIVVEATGLTRQQLKDYFTSPERYFNQVFGSGYGENVDLQTFNQEYLHISDTGYTNPAEQFEYQKFPAAYNTVAMSKLILMSQDSVNQLLADLNDSSRLDKPNIMLGFIETLDGSNQWQQKMILARNCNTYRQVFMFQPGEDKCPADTSYPFSGATLTFKETDTQANVTLARDGFPSFNPFNRGSTHSFEIAGNSWKGSFKVNENAGFFNDILSLSGTFQHIGDSPFGDILTFNLQLNADDAPIGGGKIFTSKSVSLPHPGIGHSDLFNVSLTATVNNPLFTPFDKITDWNFTLEAKHVPEPSSVLGVLAFGALGAGSLLKRKQKQKVLDNRLN